MVGKLNRGMLISSAVSHALAWVVYLVVSFGLVLWPAWQGGDGDDLIVLATLFMPVALSGLGWLTVLTQGRQAGGKARSSTLVGLLLVFCALAILSIVFIHLPTLVKLAISIIIGFYPVVLALDVGRGGRSLLLGITAALLLGFSALAIFSVGVLFLPTALAMVGAALASLVARSSPEAGRIP